jgi:hypothetical protein
VSGSDGETARGFRDRPLGKAVVIAAVLLAAVLVSRTCGATTADVPQDDAIEIAKRYVDFEPDRVQIRLVKQGLQQREIWLVGLAKRAGDGSYTDVTSVLIDANTGKLVRIEESR